MNASDNLFLMKLLVYSHNQKDAELLVLVFSHLYPITVYFFSIGYT